MKNYPYKLKIKTFCPTCKEITDAEILDDCICQEENGDEIYYGVKIKVWCKKCNKIVYEDKEERGYFL